MLFNTFSFTFIFFPFVLIVSLFIRSYGSNNLHIYFLILASLYFYSFFIPIYTTLILFSIILNFLIAKILLHIKKKGSKLLIFLVCIFLNLILLIYYKYFNFLVENINLFTNAKFKNTSIILPLAISFFTFQQLAFITSIYKNEIKNLKFKNYFLFISFFPQLIAGPIVKFKEFNPQLLTSFNRLLKRDLLYVGLFIFSIGMLKKIIFASYLSSISDPIFLDIYNEKQIGTIDSWVGLIAFSLLIYFDFSAYSDMAIGLALCLGFKLPINFFSPYKSTSLREFWKNWHITLSRFLKEHIYIPLGGNKCSNLKCFNNIFITMLLGGIWHGASWNFLIWGLYHGFLLNIEKIISKRKIIQNIKIKKVLLRVFIFFLITLGWIPFRCLDLSSTLVMINSLFFYNNFYIHNYTYYLLNITIIIFLLIIIFKFPNSVEIQGFLNKKIKVYKKNSLIHYLPLVIILGIIFIILAAPSQNINREFIYFQF